MNTLTYATSNVPSKDVLAISSLLSLFERRLSAKWLMRNHPPGQNIDVLVVDLDRPGGMEAMQESGGPRIRVAVSDNDRTAAKWLVTRPIRAYGANGVVVLFNSVADALEAGGQESRAGAELPQPSPPPQPPPARVSAPPEMKWGPPEPVETPPLVSMRASQPVAPIKQEAAPLPPPVREPEPVTQPAPAPVMARGKWREPDPEILPELIDMRTGRPVVWPVPSEPALPVVTPAEVHIAEVIESPAAAAASEPAPAPAVAQVAEVSSQPPIAETAIAAEDSSADWWNTPTSLPDPPPAIETPAPHSDLPSLLRELRRAESIGVLEIAGLPAVCVVPARKVFFSTAPVARLESAISSRSPALFRPYPTEDEARAASGTQESRQGSLNQLYWAAALATPSPLPSNLTEGPRRLKGWPPVNSSSGNGLYLRFATLLSGGAVTAAQLATLTASDPKEVTLFLQACHELGLIEAADQPKRTVATAPGSTGKVGILRSMLSQLAPPKI